MGRPRKLTDNVEGNITKAEKEQRKETEEMLHDLTPIDTEPPEWLDDVGKAEYKRIVPLLKELPIAGLDYGLVVSYCTAYSDMARASERLKEEDDIIETEHGTKLNQNHKIRQDAFKIINSVSSKLGMTIDSRLKIIVPKKEEKSDPFKEMMMDD